MDEVNVVADGIETEVSNIMKRKETIMLQTRFVVCGERSRFKFSKQKLEVPQHDLFDLSPIHHKLMAIFLGQLWALYLRYLEWPAFVITW